MQDYRKQVLLKIKFAQSHVQQAIIMFQEDTCNLKAVQKSRKAQDVLKETGRLIFCHHLNACVVDLIKKGQIDNAGIEIKRLYRYNF
ncbi:MAG: hypothetical protein A2857_04860 [Candidatus Levybacteria bacterium RIFCSPHIGHO2_01_FULL_36_15]|nr:MAG: hypothetical protein A2857_04860 [Candidatus Levybacteria bacterium RIFCSPHIGHO2_01_FULL_36_15]OGH38577.1 MAG: hypothetical protein A2905_04030 [Candidatus Levybacteria bacterium RIFCSPLOWO2_01_FULL_36_10]